MNGSQWGHSSNSLWLDLRPPRLRGALRWPKHHSPPLVTTQSSTAWLDYWNVSSAAVFLINCVNPSLLWSSSRPASMDSALNHPHSSNTVSIFESWITSSAKSRYAQCVHYIGRCNACKCSNWKMVKNMAFNVHIRWTAYVNGSSSLKNKTG